MFKKFPWCAYIILKYNTQNVYFIKYKHQRISIGKIRLETIVILVSTNTLTFLSYNSQKIQYVIH